MTNQHTGEYIIYPIRNSEIYALLDKAHCAIMSDDDDRTRETLILPQSVRFENIQIRNDRASFDVFCISGLAFNLRQIGTQVNQKFMLYCPAILPFAEKVSFSEALKLGNVTLDQLGHHYPFNIQAIYDMTATMPVRREEAAFALARLTSLSQIVFTFDNVKVTLQDDESKGEHNG